MKCHRFHVEELQPLEFVGLCIIERINPWSAWLEHLAVSVDMETVKRRRIILDFLYGDYQRSHLGMQWLNLNCQTEAINRNFR